MVAACSLIHIFPFSAGGLLLQQVLEDCVNNCLHTKCAKAAPS